MTLLFTIAFFVMTAGCLILLRLTPMQLLTVLAKPFSNKKVKMKKKIQMSIKPRKLRGIKRIIKESRDILQATNKSDRFSSLCMLSFVLCIFGVLVASSMQNLFLMPVLAAGFAILPFLYVLFSATKYKKQLNGTLETSLSIITTSYIRNENFLLAVQENIDYLNSPVRDVFLKFLTQAELINSNIMPLLEEMKGSIDNAVFQEWIDAVILCQDDRNLKSTLLPIVGKLSDMRIVAGDLDYLMYEPFKEYLMMAALLIANIPLIHSQSLEWYHTLMYTPIGQITLTVSAVILFISLIAVIRNTRPIEYKR